MDVWGKAKQRAATDRETGRQLQERKIKELMAQGKTRAEALAIVQKGNSGKKV